MAPSTLSFNTALITGGGGGIGYALAKHLIALNKKVIIAGRTEAKLQEAAQTLGHGTTYYVLDTGSISSIPAFISRVLAAHPDLDCLINNAGVQRPLEVSDFDLAKADEEIDINIRGPMHLAIGLLPHFKSKKSATIVNVSSVLGFVPFSIVNPVYNGTKAWLHFWSMNLRTQLGKDEGARGIKVVEIAPPTVETELQWVYSFFFFFVEFRDVWFVLDWLWRVCWCPYYFSRDRSDPNDNKKENNPDALSVDEFMEFVSRGFEENKDIIGAGMSEGIIQKWYDAFGETYDKAAAK